MRERVRMPPGQWKGPHAEFYDLPHPRGSGGFGIAHAVFPWLFLLLFAALVAVAIIALIRFSKQAGSNTSTAPPVAARASAPDQALQDLRLRYARGEINREEYLQKAADLGESGPITPSSGG